MALTKLQSEILPLLTNEPQSASQIEQARRAAGYNPMTVDGVRRSCENLASKFAIKRTFRGLPLYAAKGN